MFRHWTSYFDGKYSHLFLVSADGGVARDLTPGAHDVPPFSLGGQDQYSFSPDGKEIAYTSNIDEVQATSTNSDIFIVPVDRRRAEEDHHQSRQRLDAAVFARRQVHRLSLAAARRLRERPLPPDALRARHRQDHRHDAQLRSLGRFDGVVAGFEDDLLHRRERRRSADLRARHHAAKFVAECELVAGFNDSVLRPRRMARR